MCIFDLQDNVYNKHDTKNKYPLAGEVFFENVGIDTSISLEVQELFCLLAYGILLEVLEFFCAKPEVHLSSGKKLVKVTDEN